MTTLREAAQQALEALEADCCGGCDAEYNPCRQRRLAESLRAALAQQDEAVEPVAWIESPHGAIRANPNYKFTFPSQLLQWQIALYIAPPQRKPLTEEEIMHIGMTHQSLRQVVRAVEQAHGIGEQS